MNKLIMKVGDVIKAKNQELWGIVGAEIGHVDINTIKNVTLKKGSLSMELPISEVQTSTSIIDKRNLFLVTDKPVDFSEIDNAEVFAEFA